MTDAPQASTTASRPDGKPRFHHWVVRSPAVDADGPKDQDRVAWYPDEGVACLCDGLTSSPRAADAADFVVTNARSIFDGSEEPVIALSRELLALRAEANGISIQVDSELPEPVRTFVLEAAREKMRHSHQTTMVAASFAGDDDGVHLRLAVCGDSSLLAYAADGRLLFASMPVLGDPDTPDQRFAQASTVTDALPDCAKDTRFWEGPAFPADTVFLLTSDGLTQAFDTPRAMFDWFVGAYRESPSASLPSTSRGPVVALQAAHDLLKSRSGDDDVTCLAIWLQ